MITERVKSELKQPVVFNSPGVKELIEQEVTEGIWLDPFAGGFIYPKTDKLQVITNDFNTRWDTDYNLDVYDFFQEVYKDNYYDGIILNPPLTPTEMKQDFARVGRYLEKRYVLVSFYTEMRSFCQRMTKPDGKIIIVSYNSGGMSKSNGYEIERLRLVCFGKRNQDLICTVNRKADN